MQAYDDCSNRNGQLAGFSTDEDKAAVAPFLSASIPQVFTSEATSGGKCPLATANGLVMGTCFNKP